MSISVYQINLDELKRKYMSSKQKFGFLPPTEPVLLLQAPSSRLLNWYLISDGDLPFTAFIHGRHALLVLCLWVGAGLDIETSSSPRHVECGVYLE